MFRSAAGRSAGFYGPPPGILLLGGRGGGRADGGVVRLAGLELGVAGQVHQLALVLEDVLAVGELAAQHVMGMLQMAVGNDVLSLAVVSFVLT